MHSLAIDVPTSAAEVATLQRQAEQTVDDLAEIAIDSPDDYTFATEVLTAIVRRKDAAVAMRKRATVPLYQAVREIESWFRPVTQPLEGAERLLKRLIGEYRIALEAREREARELAAAAATAGDSDALVEALTDADAAAAPPPGRATARMHWRPKRVDAGMLPAEYLIPDMPRIEAEGRAAGGDEPPVIPGVVWERAATIGARR